jgi:hypothetical protein
MRVRDFIIADTVTAADRKAYIHGAGVKSIPATTFPYAHPKLGLYVTIVFEQAERGDPHRVVVAVQERGQNAAAVIVDSGETRFPDVRVAGEETVFTATFVVDVVGLEFSKAGSYAFVLIVDEQELDGIWFDVGATTTPASHIVEADTAPARTTKRPPSPPKKAKRTRR